MTYITDDELEKMLRALPKRSELSAKVRKHILSVAAEQAKVNKARFEQERGEQTEEDK